MEVVRCIISVHLGHSKDNEMIPKIISFLLYLELGLE